jgi:hypothetical protein
MGTRNATIVILNNEVKIAQYGQFDGYPSGVGIDILSYLGNPKNQQDLKENLPFVRFVEQKELDDFYKSIGIGDEKFLNNDAARLFNQRYPLVHRENAGKILNLVGESETGKELEVINKYNFVDSSDGFSCVWAYVVDFDKNQLEVYSKYGKKEIRGRFPTMVLEHTFQLNDLPSNKEFLKILEPKEEEED